jgi:hypothetical protein
MEEDLEALELRVREGAARSRGGHDPRARFKTRAIDEGADSEPIRLITHAPTGDLDSSNPRFSWATYCREVAKRRISAEPRGHVLEPGTALRTVEKRARGLAKG